MFEPIFRSPSTGSKAALVAALLAGAALASPAIASAAGVVALQQGASAPETVDFSENLAFVRPPLEDVTRELRTDRVSFVNHATVAATEVDFRVVRDGQTRIVNDRGTFAPGVTITRTTTDYEGDGYASSPTTWSVVAVHYADGTSWTKVAAPSVASAK